MNRRLPLLEGVAEATSRCTYCPKLCRPACPVSTVEARETTTPWGKMRAMDELLRGVPAEEETSRAAVAWACTGCGRCGTLCLLDNPVAESLWAGRADAFANSLAPAAATKVSAGWSETSSRLAAAALREGLATSSADVSVVAGCRGVTERPDEVRAALRSVASLGERACGVLGSECCGQPLWDAGDRDGFVAQAKRFVEAAGAATELVVLDAGCAFALRVLYPQLGLAPSRWRRVEHLAEFAARHLDGLAEVPFDGAVAVHDSCRLGRGLGVYDAPRAVLHRIVGRAPEELPNAREHSTCSGGGGLVPVTRPATAQAMARELAGEAGDVTVATTCFSSAQQLRRAGTKVRSLAEWIELSLGGADGGGVQR